MSAPVFTPGNEPRFLGFSARRVVSTDYTVLASRHRTTGTNPGPVSLCLPFKCNMTGISQNLHIVPFGQKPLYFILMLFLRSF
jgi:hypothetical protein